MVARSLLLMVPLCCDLLPVWVRRPALRNGPLITGPHLRQIAEPFRTSKTMEAALDRRYVKCHALHHCGLEGQCAARGDQGFASSLAAWRVNRRVLRPSSPGGPS